MTTPNPPDQAASAGVVDLDRLEGVAKAADFEWELTKRGLVDADGSGFREYAKAAKPTVVLALITEIRAHREREASAGWVACSERMPERGAEVLFRGRNWRTAECGFLAEDGWEVRTMSDEDTEYYLSDITHWMPLPTPPAPEAPAPTETL